MRIFKKTVIFICLNLLVAQLFQFVLVAPSKFELRFADFKRGSYHTVILGHSLGYRGVDPHVIGDSEKDRAFNICQGGEPFHNFYYLLREMNEISPLKKVYLDLYFDYWTQSYYQAEKYNQNMELYRVLSPGSRLEFMMDVFFSKNYNTFFCGYGLSEESIRHIPQTVKTKLSSAYRHRDPSVIDTLGTQNLYRYTGQGFEYAYNRVDADYRFRQFDRTRVCSQAIRDFDRIVSYCAEHEIELICFTSALPVQRLLHENHNVVHDFFADVCQTRGVAYYDMNYVRFDLFPRTVEDYLDEDGHMLGSTARRQTLLLKEIAGAGDRTQAFEQRYEDVLMGIEKFQE